MQRRIHGAELDFDEWRELARTDPREFERRRTEVLQSFIEEAPPHHRERLRRLQWRIDMERRLHWRSPLVAAQRLYAMMMESAVGRDGLLPALQALTDAAAGPRPASLAKGNVVAFKTARR